MLTVGLEKEADILEVIADLSNDEVFTPPAVVRIVLDLLPANVWANPELRWLDPGCKTGVFLREITRRLMVGLAETISDDVVRLEHILKNQVFGIAITELTSLISRRSLYLSKDAHGEHSIVAMPKPAGNLWFKRVEHTYKNGRCAECNASEELMEKPERDNHAYGFVHAAGREAIAKEINMKFDVIVGNPPYQMAGGGGGTNDTPLYNLFVDQAKALDPQFITMIIPSRWMAGGRGLDEFRTAMLKDKRIRHLVDYPNALDLFPGVDIKSGICYFEWERDNPGVCHVTTSRSGVADGPHERKLDEFDVFVRDRRAVDILHKVRAQEEPSFQDLLTGDTPFGLPSNFADYEARDPKAGEVQLIASKNGVRKDGALPLAEITKNTQLINEWKVLLPKAGPGNSGGHVLPDMVLGRPIPAGPNSVCTQTYIVSGPLESETAAKSVDTYLRTRFLRFIVSLRKISQDAMRGVYRWVPQQTWDHEWADDELYEKYDITEDEQTYIAEMIREMG